MVTSIHWSCEPYSGDESDVVLYIVRADVQVGDKSGTVTNTIDGQQWRQSDDPGVLLGDLISTMQEHVEDAIQRLS